MRCEHCKRKNHCLVALGEMYRQGRFDAEMDMKHPQPEEPKNLFYDIKPPASPNQRIYETLHVLKKIGITNVGAWEISDWSEQDIEFVEKHLDFLVETGKIKEA